MSGAPIEPVIITRERNYPTVAHPGPAWVYLYTIAVPGDVYPMKGTGIGWARRMAKARAEELGRKVIEAWAAPVAAAQGGGS